jgi:hypothetical protein
MITRFQVMAILQAARAYVLGLTREEAESFGLNRAIFYAAAKKGFLGKRVHPPDKVRIPGKPPDYIKEVMHTMSIFQLGDEWAYSLIIEGKRLFFIGEQVQTSEDFYKQVAKRFGLFFEKAWEQALSICKNYPEGVLKSQRYFYETVYKVRRDKLVKEWNEALKEMTHLNHRM